MMSFSTLRTVGYWGLFLPLLILFATQQDTYAQEVCVPSAEISAESCLALETFAEASSYLSFLMESAEPCTLPEIGCSGGEITSLYLSVFSLRELPAEIAGFEHLHTLTLENNSRLKTLPPELGEVTSLQELVLIGNNITDLPPEIGNLTRLTKLVIEKNDNALFTQLPAEIGQLSNLLELRIERNFGLESIPAELGQLPILQSLTVYSNGNLFALPSELTQLENSIPSYSVDRPYLMDCANVGTFSAEDCATLLAIYPSSPYEYIEYVTSADPCTMDEIQCDENGKITHFYLKLETIIDLANEIGQLDQLSVLRIEGEYTTPIAETQHFENGINYTLLSIPPELGLLENLTELHLIEHNLLTSITPELANLTNLVTVTLSGMRDVEAFPIELAELPNLQSLTLENFDNDNITTIPESIAELPLQTLQLSDNDRIVTIPVTIAAIPSLTDLTLTENGRMSSLETIYRPLEDAGILTTDIPILYSCDLVTTVSTNDCEVLQAIVATDVSLDYLLLTTDPCQLDSIGCADMQIITMTIADNPRVVQLPPELGQLSGLQQLTIDNNNLFQYLPTEFNQLTALTDLTLTNLSTINNLPEVDQLTELQTVDIQNNFRLTEIPSTFGSLPSIEMITITDNRQLTSIPSTFRMVDDAMLTTDVPILFTCDDVTTISAEDCQTLQLMIDDNYAFDELLILQDPCATDAIECTDGRVTTLNIVDKQLITYIVPEITQLTALEVLRLEDNRILEAIPVEIGDFENLTELYIINNDRIPSIPDEIGQLSTLQILEITHNFFLKEITTEIVQLDQLHTLLIERNSTSLYLPAAIIDFMDVVEAREPSEFIPTAISGVQVSTSASILKWELLVGLFFIGSYLLRGTLKNK